MPTSTTPAFATVRRAVLAFVLAFPVGWALGTPTAECRACNAKKCFWDADCGRLCACVFPGGKKGTKKGSCAQVGG